MRYPTGAVGCADVWRDGVDMVWRAQPTVVAPVLGALTVGTAAVGAHGPVVVAVVAALIAVAAGTLLRSAATLAVLLTVIVLVISDAPAPLAALSGLYAAAYLLCRHAGAAAAHVVTCSPPTMVSVVGFTFAGLVATSFPLQLPWLPLIAPLAVLAIYVVATRPFVG